MPMLKLCAYKKQLFHPPLYLSHAQKILPQTVMVSHPYLRLPWRFLHPQVGKTHSPITCPRMCPSRVGLVCHHVLCFFFSVCQMCAHSEAMFILYKLHSTLCKKILKSPTVQPFTCLCIFHTCICLDSVHAILFASLNEHSGRQGFTESVSCTQINR